MRRSGGGATLRQSAAAAIGVDPDSGAITWDAWRREDGKWVVTARFADHGAPRAAHWTYDHAGRNIHPLDDEARALMGVRALEVERDPIADALDLVADREPAPAPRPRLVAVPDAEDTVAVADRTEITEIVERVEVVEVVEAATLVEEPAPVEAPPAVVPAPAAAPARKAKSRRTRASVPSWDEILFGATRPEDPS